MRSIYSLLVSFFPQHMRHQIRELYFATMILNFGVAMILLFEPIYLYTLGYTIQQIILFFLIVYVVYFFIMPFGAYFAKRFGFEHSILVSTFVFIAYYFFFYNIATVHWFFFVAPFLYALQKTFYWPAYHADFARYANTTEDGREVGGIDMAVLIVSAIAPFVAGVIVQVFGFATLFASASVVFLLSNIPLLVTKEIFVPKPFPYMLAYRNLVAKENRRAFLSYLGYGEELVVLVVWPVFMVIIVKNFFDIGGIVTIATLITLVVTLTIGRASDKRSKRRILRFGSIMYSFVWFVRTAVQGVWGIFFIDTLSRLSKEVVSIPLVSLTYEHAQQKSVMQGVILYEMSLVVGKLLSLLLIYCILFVVPQAFVYQATFILAGFMSLLYMGM